jgi:hypothetical protein
LQAVTSGSTGAREPPICRQIGFLMARQGDTDLAVLCDLDAGSRGCRQDPAGCAGEFTQLLADFEGERDPG